MYPYSAPLSSPYGRYEGGNALAMARQFGLYYGNMTLEQFRAAFKPYMYGFVTETKIQLDGSTIPQVRAVHALTRAEACSQQQLSTRCVSTEGPVRVQGRSVVLIPCGNQALRSCFPRGQWQAPAGCRSR